MLIRISSQHQDHHSFDRQFWNKRFGLYANENIENMNTKSYSQYSPCK